jgi:predicted double-glycine peptidase
MRKLNHLVTMTVLVWWVLLRTSPALAGEVRVPTSSFGAGISVSVEVKSIKEMREDEMVLQRLDYSCGSAALSTMFTSYLHQAYTEEEIIDFLLQSGNMQKFLARKGFSMLDLKRFAEAHGVKAIGYELDLESLAELNQPVLIPLFRKAQDMRHFVIFRGMHDGRVFLADPAVGRTVIPVAQFEEEWTPRVGMVFQRPGWPTCDVHALAVEDRDRIYLDTEQVRALITNTVADVFHQANEF